jgi:putative ABC transport system ATP-binding protein
VITHNAVIAGMADRVVSILDGRIAGIRTHSTKVRPAELVW